MTESTRRTALGACLTLGLADLFAVNMLILPHMRQGHASMTAALPAARAPAARVDVEVSPAAGMKVRAFGATHPAVAGDDAQALQRNRRVEIVVRREEP